MGDTRVAAGLVAGTCSAAIFSPVDKALFLSHVNKRPFLRIANFSRPFQGINLVVVQRVISGGLCFPLEDAVRRAYPGEMDSAWHNFASGTIVGSSISIVTNPLASITFQKWASSRQSGASVAQVARHMFATGGLSSFQRAVPTTLARDVLWGGIFSCLRHELPAHLGEAESASGAQKPGVASFVANVVAAGVATAVSSPFNYARSLQYGHDMSKGKLSTMKVFKDLWREANANRAAEGEARALFVARRLTVGWGSLRVSVGIAVSSQIYNFCSAVAD